MGKQPTAGAGAAAGAASRKRNSNESGQRSIAAVFQAAKRPHHTREAGKSNSTGPVAPDTTQLGSDQLEAAAECQLDPTPAEAAAAAGKGAGSGSDHRPSTPEADATTADCGGVACQQQQQQQEAEPINAGAGMQQQQQEQQQPAAAQKQQRGKAAAAAKKAPAAGARKPRASKSKAAAAAATVKDAYDSAAEDGAADPDAQASDGDGDAAAAGSSAAAAVAAAAASFDKQEIAQVQESLLAWYDRVQRVLPWRRNPHHKPQQNPEAKSQQNPAAAADDGGSGSSKQKKPSKKQLEAAAEAEAVLAAARPAPATLSPQEFAYYVWVSEIMLQQTQVSRVVTYFNKWIAAWPTVAALAAASQEEVNQVWAGLGYYRRARYLLEGAQHIMNKLGGKFPETAAELRQIPGVGPYTAAAVASIAFNDRAAAVDGNVIRVCARLRALRGNPTKMAKVWDKLAAQLLRPERPGCHNQAMMELGATVCKPVNPSCGTCPVSSCCAAFQLVAAHAAAGGNADVEDAPRVTDYPEKVAKAAKAEQQVAVCVLKVLLLPAADTAAAVAAAAAGSAASAAAAAGKGSIRSFFKPAPKQQQQQQACEGDLLAAGAAAHYLLVQRPDTGVLAGLWEFPGVVINSEPTPTARRAAVDGYLSGPLGVLFPASSGSIGSSSSKRAKGSGSTAAAAAADAGVRVVQRRQLGSVVHIFSHIRQTLHAEELVLLAPSLDAVCSAAAAAAGAGAGDACAATAGAGEEEEDEAVAAAESSDDEQGDNNTDGKQGKSKKRPRKQTAAVASASVRPALRWVAGADMVQTGLTSGVRKVFNLSIK